FKLELTEIQGEETVLKPKFEKELLALGLEKFGKQLKIHLKEPFQDRLPSYSFSNFESVAFDKALSASLQRCARAETFPEGSSLIRAVLFLLPFERLDTPNIMNSIHSKLSGFALNDLRFIKKTLFEDIAIGNFSPDARRALMGLFEEANENKETIQKLVGGLLDSVQMIYEFDRQEKPDLPSAFESYRSWVAETPDQQKRWVSEVLSFLSRSHFFSLVQKNNDPKSLVFAYPSVAELVKNQKTLATILYAFSLIDPQDHEVFLAPLRAKLGTDRKTKESGFSLLLQFLSDVMAQKSAGLHAVLTKVLNAGASALPNLSDLLLEERKWLIRFVKDDPEALRKLLRFSQAHLTKSSVLGLASDLRTLSRQGDLKQALQLLTYIQNEKMQKIATVLLEWETSGELDKLLQGLEILLGPLQQPSQATPYQPFDPPPVKSTDLPGTKSIPPPIIKPTDPPVPKPERPPIAIPPVVSAGPFKVRIKIPEVLEHPKTGESDKRSEFVWQTDLPKHFSVIDPEIGGSEEETLRCLSAQWRQYIQEKNGGIAEKKIECAYARELFYQGKEVAKTLPDPCVAKVIRFKKMPDQKWMVLADGSCIAKGKVEDFKRIIEDTDHYREKWDRKGGEEWLTDGFAYVLEYVPLDPATMKVWKKDKGPLPIPTLIYGHIKVLNAHSHYLLELSPVQGLHSGEYAMRWESSSKPVRAYKQPSELALGFFELGPYEINTQYGSWFAKQIAPDLVYIRYYLASIPPQMLIGKPPQLILAGPEKADSLVEGLYPGPARNSHQRTMLGLVQRLNPR
ncbi:MAG: hypothetical protein HY537_17565, partial [Deltaproteobacteria bacterium]|nr:hypothetical protein [Deltaproteobacteria bacterium]